jgi:hypothetical protein
LDTERTDDVVLNLVLRGGCESHDGHAGVISSKFAESQICGDDQSMLRRLFKENQSESFSSRTV